MASIFSFGQATQNKEIENPFDMGKFDIAKNNIKNIPTTYTNYRNDNISINSSDVWKDGLNANVSVGAGNRDFIDSLQKIFIAPQKNYKNVLDTIKEEVKKNQILGGNLEKISWLKKPDNLKGKKLDYAEEPDKLPAIVIYASHDSGFTPSDLKKTLNLLLTPGSYIDPAGRQKDGLFFPNIDTETTIEFDVFNVIGFPEMKFTAKINPDYTCDITITGKYLTGEPFEIREKRDSKHQHGGAGTDYFCGNTEKNQMFINGISPNEGAKYQLCKELGDTMQVIYAKLFQEYIGQLGIDKTSVCVFTTDDVVAARTRMNGLPYVVQDHAIQINRNIHSCYYYSPESDPTKLTQAINNTYIDHCLKNNRNVSQCIAKAIADRKYILGGQEIDMNNYVQTFLQSLIDQISQVNTVIDSNRNTIIDNATFKLTCSSCLAYSVIDQRLKISQTIKRLFPKEVETSLNGGDVIAINNKPFAQQIQQLQSQRGGGEGHIIVNDNNKIIQQDKNPEDISNYDSITDLFLENVRKIFININPHLSYDVITDYSLDFLYTIYNYLYYVGETPLNEGFLTECINLYLNNQLTDITLSDFKITYDNYNFNIRKDKRKLEVNDSITNIDNEPRKILKAKPRNLIPVGNYGGNKSKKINKRNSKKIKKQKRTRKNRKNPISK